jgi:ABC-type uncharacterized transport system ATPase subunit
LLASSAVVPALLLPPLNVADLKHTCDIVVISHDMPQMKVSITVVHAGIEILRNG